METRLYALHQDITLTFKYYASDNKTIKLMEFTCLINSPFLEKQDNAKPFLHCDADFLEVLKKNQSSRTPIGSDWVCIFDVSRPRRIFAFVKATLHYIKERHLTVATELVALLNQALHTYQLIINSKPRAPAAKNRNCFTSIAGVLPETHNPTFIAEKKSKRNAGPAKKYIVKGEIGGKGGARAEWEAYNAEKYRLLGEARDHAPTYSLYNDENEFAGVASRFIEGETLHDRFERTLSRKFTKNELVNAGFGRMLAALFLNGEMDGHFRNILWVNRKLVKIDGDRSFWIVTCKYFDKSYQHEFAITPEILRTFPLLPRPPHHWITQHHSIGVFLQFTVEELKKDPAFVFQVFYIFLKAALIPLSTYAAIAQSKMSSRRPHEAYQHEVKNHFQLRSALKKLPEFQLFLVKYPTIITTILDELGDYNQKVLRHFPSGCVNLQEIKNEFSKLYVCACNVFLRDFSKKSPLQIQARRKKDQHVVNNIQHYFDQHDQEQSGIKKIHFIHQRVILTKHALLLDLKKMQHTHSLLKRIHSLTTLHYSVETIWNAVHAQCKKHFNKCNFFSPEKKYDVLCRAVLQVERNLLFNPAIKTVAELILAQQKRDAIVQLQKKIHRLQCPHVLLTSQGQVVYVPHDMVSDHKALQLKELVRALLSKDNIRTEVGACITEVINDSAFQKNTLFGSRGILPSTTKKLVERFESCPSSYSFIS